MKLHGTRRMLFILLIGALAGGGAFLVWKLNARRSAQSLRLEARRLTEEGSALNRTMKWTEAEANFRRALALSERIAGPDSVECVDALNGLANLLVDRGDLAQAETLLKRAYAILSVMGEQSSQGVIAHLVYVRLYLGRYEFAAGLEAAQQTLALAEKVHGAAHPRTAEALNMLGTFHSRQGNFDRSIEIHEQALAMQEKLTGRESREVLNVLFELAGDRSEVGQFAESEALYQRALSLLDKLYGPEHIGVAGIMSRLASTYATLGDAKRTIAACERGLRVNQKHLPDGNADQATLYGLMAAGYTRQRMYKRAEEYHKRALQIREQQFGPASEFVAFSLSNLGAVYSDQGLDAQAEPLYLRALHIHEAVLGPRHPTTLTLLDNIAGLYLDRKHFDRAETKFREVLKMRQETLGENHPATGDTVQNLGWSLIGKGQFEQALPVLWRALALKELQLHTEGLSLSDDRLASLLELQEAQDEGLYTFAWQRPEDRLFQRLALSASLLHKGRLLEDAAAVSRIAQNMSDPQDRQKLERLRSLRSRYASLSFAGPPSGDAASHIRTLQELETEADELEQALAVRSAPLRRRLQVPPPADILERVAASLPKDGVLVEIVAFRMAILGVPFSKQTEEISYLAWLLFPDRTVVPIKIDASGNLNAAIARLRATLAEPATAYLPAVQEVYRRVMAPIVPQLRGQRQLFLSLDGQLLTIPFAALHDGKQFLADRYQLRYLSSGRELLNAASDGAHQRDVVVIADPAFFDLPEAPSGVRAPPGTRLVRGFKLTQLAPLPGTRAEAQAIQGLIPTARLLLGRDASKSALLGLRAPGILHLATHGIAVSGEDVAESQASRGFDETAILPSNPLLRSALVLAGARATQTGPAPAASSTQSDSLATALELSSMDFQGTQLVVLSACESGRGDLRRGQGIYGLRRAFLSAGAETVVASLWKVNDQTTATLMRYYYQNLLRGDGRADAMDRAGQLQRRSYPHPHDWAAFQVIGRSGPLHGLSRPAEPAAPLTR